MYQLRIFRETLKSPYDRRKYSELKGSLQNFKVIGYSHYLCRLHLTLSKVIADTAADLIFNKQAENNSSLSNCANQVEKAKIIRQMQYRDLKRINPFFHFSEERWCNSCMPTSAFLGRRLHSQLNLQLNCSSNVLDHISDDVRLRRTSRAGVPPLPGAPAAPTPPGEGGIPLGAPARR